MFALSLVIALSWAVLLWSVFTDADGDDRALVGDVEPWTGRLYIADTSARSEAVLIVEARVRRAHIVQSFASGTGTSIAVSADGSRLVEAFIACGGCGGVLSVVDTRWGHVEQRIPLSWPDGRRYVAPARQTVTPTVALSPDGRVAFAWATGPGLDVSIGTIDVDQGTVSAMSAGLDPGCAPGDVLVPLPEPRTIAIVCAQSRDVRFLSIAADGSLLDAEAVELPSGGADGSIGRTPAGMGVPVAATPSSDLSRLFMVRSDGTVVTLDLANREIDGVVGLLVPRGHVVAPGATLVFSAAAPGELAVAFRPAGPGAHAADVIRTFDAETWRIRTEVTVDDPFEVMTRAPDDDSLLVFHRGRPGLRVVDRDTGRVTQLLTEIRRPGFAVVPLLSE